MTTFVFSGTRPSISAGDLTDALIEEGHRTLKIRTKNSKYIPKHTHVIINWGSTAIINGVKKIINHPGDVKFATNKLLTFEIASQHGINIPWWTTRKTKLDSKKKYLARTTLTGKGGEGIVVINPGDPIPDAKMYVEYIPKKYEVRVHVMNGKTFDRQQKMNKLGAIQDNWEVRSHGNGFVFARNNMTVPGDVWVKCQEQAEKIVKALGLDFGAVDVIYNEKQGKAYVLEVNTAPGVEKSTAKNYAKRFKQYIETGV